MGRNVSLLILIGALLFLQGCAKTLNFMSYTEFCTRRCKDDTSCKSNCNSPPTNHADITDFLQEKSKEYSNQCQNNISGTSTFDYLLIGTASAAGGAYLYSASADVVKGLGL